MTSTPHGVLPVLATPFTTSGDLDLPGVRSQIDFVLHHGADGVVLGMVSEVLRLSSEERDQLGAAVAEHVNGRASVIASVGAESSHTAIRYAKAAEAGGASALMAIPPIGTACDDLELHSYYSRIVETVDIPVVVQDASGYLGRPLSIELQAQLHREYGDRVLFKPEAQPIGPRLTALLDATDGSAKVYEGTGGLALVDSFRRGIAGTMPGPDIVWALVALWRALERGDDEAVYTIQGPMTALVSIQNSLDSFVAVQKYLLRRQGVEIEIGAREPVGYRLDAQTVAEVDRLYDRLAQTVSVKV